MTEIFKRHACIDGVLKGTSADVVNIPHEMIKELGWKINEPVEITIVHCSNGENEDWQEIQIVKKEDIDRGVLE